MAIAISWNDLNQEARDRIFQQLMTKLSLEKVIDILNDANDEPNEPERVLEITSFDAPTRIIKSEPESKTPVSVESIKARHEGIRRELLPAERVFVMNYIYIHDRRCGGNMSARQIAKQFGLSIGTISNIYKDDILPRIEAKKLIAEEADQAVWKEIQSRKLGDSLSKDGENYILDYLEENDEEFGGPSGFKELLSDLKITPIQLEAFRGRIRNRLEA